jgi:hypothetical protein
MSTPATSRVRLTFAKRQGLQHTHWIEIEAPSDAEPLALYADLRAAGWGENFPSAPAHQAYDDRTFKPLGYTVVEHMFTKPGSDLFKMWNAVEARAFMTQARAILRKHGFERVPVWHKTLADML